MSRAKLVLAGAFILSAIALLVLSAVRLVEHRRLTEEVGRLRDELYRARVSADRCRSSLVTSESALSTLRVTIDSLKTRIDSFEALGNGRVPADRYDEYLQVFETYNDSVAVWDVRSDRLRAAESACRDMIDHHNAVSDSIQSLLDEAGVSSP